MTQKYWYHDYVKTLSERLVSNLSTIEVEHNFEYGAEFEIVLCTAIRSALPDNYGVARGYVVDAQGTRAGDDVIIFERSRFPTLALREPEEYARKEFIPIEAAYCYIEAKHTLNLQGEDGQSLRQAVDQVKRVKELCSKREEILPNQISPYTDLRSGVQVTGPPDFPPIKNPAYTAIFARQVRREKAGPILRDAQEVMAALEDVELSNTEFLPDLIVLGENNVIIPVISKEETGERVLRSPFYISGKSEYGNHTVEGIAFGIAFASLMYALDWVELGVMPWRKIIENGLGVRE